MDRNGNKVKRMNKEVGINGAIDTVHRNTVRMSFWSLLISTAMKYNIQGMMWINCIDKGWNYRRNATNWNKG